MKTSTVIGLGILALLGMCMITVAVVIGGLFLHNYLRFYHREQRVVEHDRVDLTRLNEAERAIRKGKGQEALVALAPLEVIDSNRGCMITLIRASALCMTEGTCSSVRDQIEFGKFTGLIHGCDELYRKLLSYSAYTSRYASPKAAAELIDLAMYADSWLSPRCDLQLVQAEYCLRGGEKKKAAALCQRLWDDGHENNWKWSYVTNNAAFKTKLTELKREAGESDERWLQAKELQDFPANCTIYLQPLGNVDMKLLEPVRANVQSFFGASTKILPMIPLTHRERSYMPQEAKYDADHLRPDTIRNLRVPSDAFSVVLITGEKIGTLHIEWIYAQSSENRHLVSYYIWNKWELHWQIVVLSNVVVSNLSRQLGLEGTFPCVSTSSGNMDTMRRVKFAYAPEIQEKYRSLDLLAAQKRSIEDFKAWGATIVDPQATANR